MTVTVKHSKTNTITDWTQAYLNEQIALGNFPPGTLLADIVLPSDWNNNHTFTGTLDVTNGGTGAATLTGYVKGSGTSAFTASATIPNTDITGLGTISTQNANNVSITGGSINGTTIGATTASTGKFSDLTDTGLTSGRVTYASTGGNLTDSANLTFNGTTLTSAQQTNLATSSGNVQVGSTTATEKLDVSGGMIIRGTTNQTSGNGGLYLGTLSSTSTLTAINPSIAWFNMSFAANTFSFSPQNAEQVRFSNTNASVNYHNFTGGATTKAPIYSVLGSDSNISMAFQPKGTGAIDLAAGSSGVNISNGGTVTAITRTATGSGYTSIPSVAISAPTTAGGVTATATANMFVFSVTVANGGTGYTVGDVLSLVGGTGAAGQVTVATVSVGVITGITNGPSNGLYSALPTTPATTTGGTGSGATINITGYGVSTFTITNAGSGYIEQPTITFSGGGGSGAAAYATVGSGTTIKNLGNITTFATPNSNVLALVDKNSNGGYPTNTTVAFSMIPSANNFGANFFGSNGNLYIGTNSTSTTDAFVFATSIGTPVSNGAGGSSQFKITHTAAAVNNVQVTGAATGSRPVISTQGSDTNIDLALTPKGTGLVRFGTYVAGALVATGYINIKAADGTTYKVLVST